MTRWAPDAALRLEQAAMELFEEQGYTATTVPQIAQRAGLTTRTFFRHFADKREVLFLRDREFPAVVGSALAALPRDLAPRVLIAHGLEVAVAPLEQWREEIRRRRALVRSEDRLRERELLKSARLADAVVEALRERDVPPLRARLLAATAVAVFDAGLDAWLDAPSTLTLAEHLRLAWAELRGTDAG